MFGKKQETGGPTIIGRGDVVEGTLKVRTTLHVDGEVLGNIEAEGQVSVGPDGYVKGEVMAETVAVAGTVEGTCAARTHLHILSSGVVKGDARFQTLEVDRGGVIHGQTGSAPGDRDTEVDEEEESQVKETSPFAQTA